MQAGLMRAGLPHSFAGVRTLLTTWSNPPWEGNSHSASEEIFRPLQKPRVHYSVHRSSPMVPLLSQMNPVHPSHPRLVLTLTSHICIGHLSDLFPTVFHPIFRMPFSSSPCVLPMSCTFNSRKLYTYIILPE